MRTLRSSLFMSLDGVVEAPEQWSLAYWGDDIAAAMAETTDGADALLLGRVTYEGFAPAWSGRSTEDDPGAAFFNGVRKHVASTTLSTADWNNSTVIEGDVVEAVTALKAEDGGAILTSGSGTLVRTLLAAGLVDELRLLVYPVVVGAGRRLAEGADGRLPLRLARSEAFENGVLSLTYTAAPA